MKVRRTSQVLLGAAVAGGVAWWTYGGNNISRPYTLLDSTSQIRHASKTPNPERKALVVESGELYTTVIPEGLSISKENTDNGRRVVELLSENEVTAKIRASEESYNIARGRGVIRYDISHVASNDPMEDDHMEKIIDVPQSIAASQDGNTTTDWMFWGIFDGHGGWTTSAKLRQVLVSYVARELNNTYKLAQSSPGLLPSSASIDAAIKQGFTKLDHEIIHEGVEQVLAGKSKALAAKLLAPALSGSCALLSFYDSRSKELRVACTGDSRAILGRKSATGNWTATPLSVDQTGDEMSEVLRIRSEHPNEPNVISNGRVLGGLMPTRAFGDATYKWSAEVQEKLKKDYFHARRQSGLKTPPYVTAEPEITTTKIQPENNDFVVMASDGLWEMLTNEEVVGLVGRWLDKYGVDNLKRKSSFGSTWLPSFLGGTSDTLPVEHTAKDDDKGPVRPRQWGISTKPDHFTVEDKNVASHLVRNALGGKNRDLVSALLTLPSPYSRRYRDDLTIQVIFFGEGPDTGKVELNPDASAVKDEGIIKAKL